MLIAVGISLQVIFVIKVPGISAAHVHDPSDIGGYTVKASFQAFDAEVQCVIHLAHEQRFINLYVFTTGSGQGANFVIKCCSEVKGKFAVATIIAVGGGVHNRQGAGHCNLDRSVAEFLRTAKIVIEEVVAARFDVPIDGWQVSHRRTIAMNPVGQVVEIDTV